MNFIDFYYYTALTIKTEEGKNTFFKNVFFLIFYYCKDRDMFSRKKIYNKYILWYETRISNQVKKFLDLVDLTTLPTSVANFDAPPPIFPTGP